MSKTQSTKADQGYVAKIVPKTCGTCKHLQKKTVQINSVYGGYFPSDKNIRCGIGGFAVKKMGSCKLWE